MSFPLLAFAVFLLAASLPSGAVGPASAAGADDSEADRATRTIERWLVLGPVAQPLPAFGEQERGKYDLARLLDSQILPDVRLAPSAGTDLEWFGERTSSWRSRSADPSGSIEIDSDGAWPEVAWLASYLVSDRWRSVDLELPGSHPRRAWLDGEPVASGGVGDEAEEEVRATLKLEPGKHVLLVRTVRDPARESRWRIGARLMGESAAIAGIGTELETDRSMRLRDVLDPPRITSLAVSPDGLHVVTSVRRVLPGSHDDESWVEIRRTTNGALVESWRGGNRAREVAWSPDGRFVSFLADAEGADADESAATLFLRDRSNGGVRPLLERVAHLRGYRWSPTGRAIVFSVEEKAEADDRGVKRVAGLLDRQATYRNKQYLHLVGVPDGARRRLTAGPLGATAQDLSPDGRHLLFTTVREELSARPFRSTELWRMELRTLAVESLGRFRWIDDVVYAPDGERILITGSGEEFDGAGRNVAAGLVPNSYDRQAYIWNPGRGEVDPITRDFAPSVIDARWSHADGHVYLSVVEQDRKSLYRYDVDRGAFESVSVGSEALADWDMAHASETIVATGTSPWQAQILVATGPGPGPARRLLHPADGWFDRIRVGGVEPWSFRMPDGTTIDGRIYTPPGFDRAARYPCIVYYYGGTSPVDRSFGGRYPKEWWASNGYVVYVMQPSGATGYGQQFSAAHVNDWGKKTAEQVIEGTRRFLEAHPFVDPERVGCIGASYGGFLTMLLTTRTELFAAAVSHAGISSLSSYWGEGYWGAWYNAVAAADSFPWNRQDVYVDQSPLFRADRAAVPILLTHGADDTNVPVGESDAFFIALKLLGKEVEYVQIRGQDHWIMDHQKRIVWSKTIVAWFDRWLKDQPEWWTELYPEAEPSRTLEGPEGSTSR